TGFTVVQSGTTAAVAVAFSEAVDRFTAKAWNVHLPGFLDHNAPGYAAAAAQRCLGKWDPVGVTCVGFELPSWGHALLAVLLVVGLTALNHRGVKRAAFVNNLATIAKVAALVAVIVLLLPSPDAGNFGAAVAADPAHPGAGQVAEPHNFNVAAGLGLAVAASLFAYDGFAQATFVAGEVKNPRRTVPRAIVVAGIGVAVVYILTTFSVFHSLPAGHLSVDALSGKAPATLEALDAAFSGPLGLFIVL